MQKPHPESYLAASEGVFAQGSSLTEAKIEQLAEWRLAQAGSLTEARIN